MTTVSAASLVDAMLRLHPNQAPALGRLADALASGILGMHTFCEAVRAELGTKILLEALIFLRGRTVTLPLDAASMLAHAHACGGACGHVACTEICSMLATVKGHCLECAEPACATCTRWSHLVRPTPEKYSSPPLVATRVGHAGHGHKSIHLKEQESPYKEKESKEAMPALMMLARSALGDITTSPVASPNRLRANTPTGSSPNRLRCPKRLKTCHEQHEGSNQCLPSERIVVRATTVLEEPMRCPSAPKLRRA